MRCAASTRALTFDFGLLCLDTKVGEAAETPSICDDYPCADAAKNAQMDSKQIKTCAKQNNIKYDIVQSLVVKSVVPAGAWLNHINSASVETSDKRELAEKMILEDMHG